MLVERFVLAEIKIIIIIIYMHRLESHGSGLLNLRLISHGLDDG